MLACLCVDSLSVLFYCIFNSYSLLILISVYPFHIFNIFSSVEDITTMYTPTLNKYINQSINPGFFGPLLNVTDMFRIFGWFSKFTIIKFKLRFCINYRPENITGKPPAYKLSCNAMERFLQPSQCAMESMKMTYSEVRVSSIYNL